MNKRILIVDDESGFREMYTFLLEPLGFELTLVVNGLEAVKKVMEKTFDLIIMDVHMPVMTGPEALKKIKEIRPDQKVIILSSSSDPEHILETDVQRQGVIACLYKPADLADLEAAIEKALGPLEKPL